MRILFALLFVITSSLAQEIKREKFPVFSECAQSSEAELEKCFHFQLEDFIYKNFKMPSQLATDTSSGKVITLFEVDAEGHFKIIYVDALYPELITETKRVFNSLPTIEPATYNGSPTYSKYTFTMVYPFLNNKSLEKKEENKIVANISKEISPELENVEKEYQRFNNPQFKSYLNIPFSHSYYANFDRYMNQMGTNSHTASKPFSYKEVGKYYDFERANQKLLINKKSWWGRKLFNENLVAIQGKDYWFTLNPIWDLRLGKTSPEKSGYTYNNTRAIQLQGAIGENWTFTSSIFESQGFFADYYNRLAISQKSSGGNPAIIPGIGIAKEFKGNQFDFPSADAIITYTSSDHLNVQLGYSRNFIGDGYRSLLEGDAASPYPFVKINTSFWKIKYTNTYMWLKDVRPEVTAEKTYATKYMANHYLSWNASKRLNIGFFESVVWSNTNNRGFDVNFVNPIIFYRSVEFASSSKSGNAAIGLTAKYKWTNCFNTYGQLLIDEFAVSDVFGGENSWRNKMAYQLGGKYYNAFGVTNLSLQAEINIVRPYVYSHSEVITNYGHNNQSMGHNWGSNLNELVAIARYTRGRLFAEAKLNYGIRGLDFDSLTDKKNYGSNIYKDYDLDRSGDKGVVVGQGNKTKVVIADLNVGFLVNPSTNLKLFANFIYRSFKPAVNTPQIYNENTTWISLGLRSDVFNWYFDY
ncbi:gliding motility protein RemB [Flavobacterium oreochromis]|uniref:Gliding motility protein RemB n=1 Tax=Flavobacterium oreochromis TaxID=2906078 RepID=A0ABW8PBY9_9FLAO|nr:gliding motility protein RemB [Flavobacterium oreochromis]OWP74830.1 gliding motility protein RemB [Flavobacterium oreochromis]